MTEWRPIPGFESRYEVSDQGQVRSHAVWRGDPGPRILRSFPGGGGRPAVDLRRPGRWRSTRLIHTLVLAAFVGPRPAGLDTRHLDGDPTNNALANLVYGTRSENMRDKRRHGTDPNVNKTVCKQGHPFDAANTRWTPDGKRACRRCSRISVARRNVRIGRDWPACHALVAEYGEKWAS